MQTKIVKIQNMCGTIVGLASVTTNCLKKSTVEPLGDKHSFRQCGVRYMNDINGERVHCGLWDLNYCEHV